MMNLHKIQIINNKFEIIRYEGFGYVQNICNYDKNIFKLDKFYEPNGLEGGSCKTIYLFEVVKKDNLINSINSFKSRIEFIEDYSDYNYHTFYEYNQNSNSVYKINETESKTIKSYKLDTDKQKKCIIL